MVQFKTVGATVTAVVKSQKRSKLLENKRKDGKRQVVRTKYSDRKQEKSAQDILEANFVDSRTRSDIKHTFNKSEKVRKLTKSNSKTELIESFGSDTADGFRKLRKRGVPGSLSFTNQLSICETTEVTDDQPIEKFQKAVRKIMTMLRVVGKPTERPKETDKNMLSWTTICDDLGFTRTRYNNLGLTFDPTDFKVKKKDHISNEAIEILSLHPKERSKDQIRHCLVSLNTAVPAFCEFPKKMQTSLIQAGWYEKFEAGRVIIRQGQRADKFYLILSGQAVVTILDSKPKSRSFKHESTKTDDSLPQINVHEVKDLDTKQEYVRTARLLDKGKSFGEIALIHGSIRTATVACRTDMELLALDRPDFINIFMKTEFGKEPDHIQFLRRLDIFKGWPIDKIPWNDPKICAFTYVRRETILCHDSNKSDMIFIILSGTCRVLKSLPVAKPKLYRSEVTDYNVTPRTNRTENIKVRGSPRDRQSPILRRQRRTKLEADIAFSRSGTIMSKSKSPEQVAADAEEHINIINDVFRKRHLLPPIINEEHALEQNAPLTSVTRATSECSPCTDDKADDYIYIQMTKLGRGDVFGLEQVVLKGIGESTSSSLISEGAECILINKLFFRKHLTSDLAKQMRKKIQPFPSEEILQQKLQTQIDWQGLEQVVLKGIGESTSSSLISEGAECILINKLFFRKHLTSDLAKQMRKKIQPFPSEEILQQKLQTQIDWQVFKYLTVLDHLDFTKHVQNVSWKH